MVDNKEKGGNWGKLGGSHPMHGPRGTATQKSGVSSQEGSDKLAGGPGKPDAGPASAGFYSSATTNKDFAGQQVPGTSGATKKGGDAKFAEGGKTPMYGNRGSLPARGGRTAP
jgi:hypothetical protein